MTIVDRCTCVTLALEISVPDAGRSDREGRGSLRSSAQVCDRFVRLAQRVRLLIVYRLLLTEVWFVTVLQPDCLPAGTADTAGKICLLRA